MTTEQEKILYKVRKLIALSTSPNENEAAAAAEKAQAMLAEYNLSMHDIESSETRTQFHIEEGLVTRHIPAWKILGNAVGRLYFTAHFFVTRGPRNNPRVVHSFVGEQHNIDVAKLMFEYLIKAIERLAQQGARQLPKSERNRYLVAFRNMATYTLCKRIRDRIEAARAGKIKGATGQALVLASLYDLTGAAVREHMLNAFPKMKTKNVSRTVQHAGGARDGERAGREIGLDDQVGGGRKSTLIK